MTDILQVWALQRSGHHAVIQWAMANAHQPTSFLNNCVPGTNPFESCSPDSLRRVGAEESTDDQRVIIGYEDRSLSSVVQPIPGPWRTARSARQVLVIRDPFNTLASKWHWASTARRFAPSLDSVKRLPALWKEYARAALGGSESWPRDGVVVCFNKWVTSTDYRRSIAAALDIGLDDIAVNRVARWGPNTWGDSFDNMSYDGRALDMPLTERWKAYAHDPGYRGLFDRDMLALSQAICGHIPGVEDLIQ